MWTIGDACATKETIHWTWLFVIIMYVHALCIRENARKWYKNHILNIYVVNIEIWILKYVHRRTLRKLEDKRVNDHRFHTLNINMFASYDVTGLCNVALKCALRCEQIFLRPFWSNRMLALTKCAIGCSFTLHGSDLSSFAKNIVKN